MRTVEVRGTQFLINGEPFYFQGFGKHEDIAVRGKGHDDAYLVHDFELLDWIGANSFRTSHYPYAEEVYDYADRKGIVVIDEVAAVGQNMGLAGGVFGGQGYITFSPETINDVEPGGARAGDPRARAPRQEPPERRAVVDRERAGVRHGRGAEEYFEPLFALARELDPSRPVGFVNVMLAPHGGARSRSSATCSCSTGTTAGTSNTGDLRPRRRPGWPSCRSGRRTASRSSSPSTAPTPSPALHSLTPQPWSEEYQVEYLDMNHRVFDAVDAVVGEQVWNFADFATAAGICRVDGNKKGVFTRDRRPKAAAHLLRRRWTGKP